MHLRYFNDAGMSAARELLERIREGNGEAPDDDFLQDASLTADADIDIKRPRAGEIKDRWQLGLWLYQRLHGRLPERQLIVTEGLWTWLAFFLFDLICPPGSKVGEEARYIFQAGNPRRAYRHLVAGPFFAFRTHADAPQLTRLILANPPSKPGDVYEQIAGRQNILTSRGALTLAQKLYLDDAGKIRREARAKKQGEKGSLRRLGVVLNQVDRTHDVFSATDGGISQLLPGEFDQTSITGN